MNIKRAIFSKWKSPQTMSPNWYVRWPVRSLQRPPARRSPSTAAMTGSFKSDNPLKSKSDILFWSIGGVLAVLYFFLEYYQPVLVESWFSQGRLALLNALSGSAKDKSFDYYLGQTEEIFFAPSAQLISGLLLTAVVLKFFKNAKPFVFGAVLFLYLILVKWEVLFFPPYGDAVGGPWMEALWLAQNNFNYAELFHQPGYAQGGPKVYMFSLYPTYIALLMKILPWTKMFLVVNHLIIFAMTAAAAGVLREIVRRFCEDESAALVGVLFLFFPIVQSQAEALNMEMPTLFFAVLSAYALILRRIHWAGSMALASLLTKGTGAFACAAFLVAGAVIFFNDKDAASRKKILGWGLALFLLAVLSVMGKYFIHDQHVSIGGIQFMKGWSSVNKFFISYFYAASLVGFLGYCAYHLWKRKTDGRAWPGQVADGGVMFIFGGMWFLLFLNFYALLQRYSVIVYPFVVFCTFYVFALVVKNYHIRKWTLIIMIAVMSFASYGYFFSRSPSTQHFILERSLEYRRGLRLHQALAKRIEEKYADFTISAQLITAQLLAFPQFGYVTKDLDVMIYGFSSTHKEIKNFSGLQNLNIRKTIYVTQSDEWFPQLAF